MTSLDPLIQLQFSLFQRLHYPLILGNTTSGSNFVPWWPHLDWFTVVAILAWKKSSEILGWKVKKKKKKKKFKKIWGFCFYLVIRLSSIQFERIFTHCVVVTFSTLLSEELSPHLLLLAFYSSTSGRASLLDKSTKEAPKKRWSVGPGGQQLQMMASHHFQHANSLCSVCEPFQFSFLYHPSRSNSWNYGSLGHLRRHGW